MFQNSNRIKKGGKNQFGSLNSNGSELEVNHATELLLKGIL